ncbi:hypothetical protein IAT38_004237 [Cryptococcus sp. DSM 104549]
MFSSAYSTRQILFAICPIAFILSVIYIIFQPGFLTFSQASLFSTNTTIPSALPREAYVTFLSSSSRHYFTSARLLLFALQHDPLTSDPYRPFIVLATPSVPRAYTQQLAAEGAVVVVKPTIEGLPSDPTNPRWRDVYAKLHVFNMTQFDRVVFYDADHLVLRPVESIWDAPGAEAPHGLAALGSGEGGYVAESDYFLAGFFVARPGQELMRGLMAERG